MPSFIDDVQLTNWKCRRRRNVFEQNFLFVAHFVSGKPVCPTLHNIKKVVWAPSVLCRTQGVNMRKSGKERSRPATGHVLMALNSRERWWRHLEVLAFLHQHHLALPRQPTLIPRYPFFLSFLIDWLIDIFIWKPIRLGVRSYRESHVRGKGVPKSREINIGMPQRRRQRVPQKWASKERRDCTRAVTDVGQGKRDKRLTPCYRSCACIWLTKDRKLISLGEYLWESACIGKWKQAVYSPFAEEGGKFEVSGRGEEMASTVEQWKLLGHHAWRGE